MNGGSRDPVRRTVTIGLLALAMTGLAVFGVWLGSSLGQVTSIYLPAGYAIAIMLLYGGWVWPAIWLGSLAAFAIQHLAGQHPLPAPAFAVVATASTLQAWIGARLLRPWLGKPPALRNLQALAAIFAYGGLLSCTLTATAGTAVLALWGVRRFGDLAPTWVIWWLGDILTVTLLTPLMLAWRRQKGPSQEERHPLRTSAEIGGVLLASGLAFSPWSPAARTHLPVHYLITLSLLPFAFYPSQRVATAVLVLISLVAMQGTAAGVGPFIYPSLPVTELMLMGYLITINLFVLVLTVGGETRRRQAADLGASERLLKAVIEGASDAIFLKDLAGHYVLINRLGAQLLGLEVEQIIGRRDDELPGLAGLATVMQDGPEGSPSDEATSKVVQVTTGGRERYLLAAFSPFRAPEGRTMGVIGVVRDISDVRQAVHDREQLQAMRQADAIKRRMLSMVSHEFRTPLQVIDGYATLLFQGLLGPLAERQKEALNGILANAKRQAVLVDNLLDLGRGLGGKFTVDRQSIHLDAVARAILDDLMPLATRKAQTLTLEVEPELPPILADGRRIGQVLSNLLTNAITFTPAGGAIQLRLRRQGDQLRTEVLDTGPGIPPAKMSALFRPFSQLEETPVQGAGLGLAIAKELVDAHNGQIGCDSLPGRGSTFWFTLPIVAPPADSLAA